MVLFLAGNILFKSISSLPNKSRFIFLFFSMSLHSFKFEEFFITY